MNKELALDIIKLLSALESWGLSSKQIFPGYLHEQLRDLIEKLSAEVLK